MFANCGFEEAELQRLISERESRGDAELSPDVPTAIPLMGLRDVPWNRPVWVSTGRLERTLDGPPVSSRALRDAVAALTRVFFDRDPPVAIMTCWDTALTPQLLDGAARFGSAKDLVSVFATTAQIKAGELVHADFRRGRLFEVPAADQCRTAMFRISARCVILLGGGKEVDGDRAALLAQRLQPHAPAPAPTRMFAVASTGGAAARALRQARADFGGNASELELEKPTSYTVLMKRILNLTGAPPNASHPPPGGHPNGHGW